MIVSKKHKTSHNHVLPGSGAIFHNEGGDLHSPMIQWNTTFSPLVDTSIQNAPPTSWVGPGCFTPLAQTQQWPCGDTHYGQPDYVPGFLTHCDSGYILDDLNHDVLIDDISQQPDAKIDSAAFEADTIEDSPYGNGEKYA